ncbi:DnaJ-related protein scj1 [Balamuthia mandrillaris]
MSRSPHRSTGPSSSVLLCCVSVALFCFSLCLLVERCAAAASGGGEDYYKLLGVTRDATEAKIKSAYKKLAAKWHPDKYKGEDKEKAVKEFQKVSKAYEVLKDEQKRRIYDQYGEEGLEQQGRRGGGGGFTDPFDLFSNFGFSTGGKRRGGGAVQERQAPPLVLELEVTLEDLYLGRVLTVTHKKQTLCPSCRGTGAKDPDDVKTCPVCHGSGMVITTHQIGPGFVTQTQSICNKCGGKGKIVKSVCPVCGGTKVGVGEETITVVVERGMSDGQKIVPYCSCCACCLFLFLVLTNDFEFTTTDVQGRGTRGTGCHTRRSHIPVGDHTAQAIQAQGQRPAPQSFHLPFGVIGGL